MGVACAINANSSEQSAATSCPRCRTGPKTMHPTAMHLGQLQTSSSGNHGTERGFYGASTAKPARAYKLIQAFAPQIIPKLVEAGAPVVMGSICLLMAHLQATACSTAMATTDRNSPPENLTARIEKARAERNIDSRLNALAGIAKELSLAEIPDALKAAESLKSLREQIALRDSTLRRWGELAPAEAFAYVAAMPEGFSKVETIRSVAAAYARTNVQAAASAALKMKAGRARNEAVSIIAETWARNDVRVALKWADELPKDGLKETALRSIYFVWAHSDPVAASTIVQNLQPGEMKDALLINIAGNWAAIDPAAAIKWAQALPDQLDKERALVIAVESWADSDPFAAVQFASKLARPSLKQRAVLAALDRWATQDPQRAFEWIAKSGDRLVHDQGIARVLSVCAPVCPDAASRWVEQLPVGPIRDGAIGAYVEAASAWHPEAATRLALKIENPAARVQRVEQCFRLWLACDAVSAQQWLNETSFSDEIKRRWLSGGSALQQ